MSKQTFTTSNSMALERPHGALGKVSTVFATKLKSFTFLPILKKLPSENRLISAWENRSSRSKPLGDPEASEENMTDKGVYKAEIVYVTDSEDTESWETNKNTQMQLTSTDNSALSPSPTPAMAHVERSCPSPGPSPVTVELTENKQPGISGLECHNTSDGAEVSSGRFLNSASQREEEVLSPASSVDLFPSIASSKESILSEGWEQDRSWSALQMLSPCDSPVPFSGTVSPCSSVRSGAFTPTVLRIKRHTLAPGSCLVHMPLSGQTRCCDSQAYSPCPLSTRARHRPPPTQLSLLTAILRKGRLPILSSALQRPYSPCWPISPVSMSSCMACSAASTIAPMEASKSAACIEAGPTTKQKWPVLTPNIPPMSSKKHNMVSITSTALATSNTFDCKSSAVSRDIPSPEDSSLLTLPSSSPSEPALDHLSKPVCQDDHVRTMPSSLLFSSFSTPRSLSPKSSHLSCCSSESQTPTPESCAYSAATVAEHSKKPHNNQGSREKLKDLSPILENAVPSLDIKHGQMPHDHSTVPDLKPAQQSKDVVSPVVIKQVDNKPSSLLQNGRKALLDLERVLSESTALKLSPSSVPTGLTRLAYTPDIPPASPRPSSCSPTPDYNTLSPSPAIPSRQLSPSPSYSFCSSPSPSLREGTPDCTERGSKNRKPYKIRSTYKALAAIPTNTLLLEQQAIDDEVEKNEASLDPSDNFAWEDPHSQLCTPAQLRQQSAELYAAIDEALGDTNPAQPPSSVAPETPRNLTSSPSPRSLGRETKYATFHRQVPSPCVRTLTKPGVIRPVTLTSRSDDVKRDEYFPNPFQRDQDNRHQYKFASNTSPAVDEVDGRAAWRRESSHEKMVPTEKPGHSVSTPAFLQFARNTSPAVDETDGRAAWRGESSHEEIVPTEKPGHSASTPAFLIAQTKDS